MDAQDVAMSRLNAQQLTRTLRGAKAGEVGTKARVRILTAGGAKAKEKDGERIRGARAEEKERGMAMARAVESTA